MEDETFEPETFDLPDPPVTIRCAREVYKPSDDSFLLIRGLRTVLEERWGSQEERAGLRALEIGTGSGVVGASLLKMGVRDLLLTDVSPLALACAEQNLRLNGLRAKLLRTSLFEGIEGRFDLIAFNPPYLPREEKEPEDLLTRALAGGEEGHETFLAFLEELPSRLARGGVAVVILSSINPVEELKQGPGAKFSWRLLGEEKFFFEKLYCFCLEKAIS